MRRAAINVRIMLRCSLIFLVGLPCTIAPMMSSTGSRVNLNSRVSRFAGKRGTTMLSKVLIRLLAMMSCAAYGVSAHAPPATAIFPFEIYDTSGEPPQPDLTARLAMATRVLSELLEKNGRYPPVD